MNSIATHVEYLLRQHDCVIVPGMGAFLCNYAPAHFDAANGLVLNPPGRKLAFNPMLSESDGVLVHSISRKEGISYENATRRLSMEVETLRHELDESGELAFGRLGTFHKGAEGQMCFMPNALPSLNGFFFGLLPVTAVPIDERKESATAPYATAIVESAMKVANKRNWRAYASGIAASLAVAVTLAMFIMSPIHINKPTLEASIAPVAAETDALDTEEHIRIANNPTEEVAAATNNIATTETATEPVSASISDKPSTTTAETDKPITKPSEVLMRFNNSDPFCVIVASFPSKGQAETYLRQHASQTLGILEKDNRFRVYSATAATFKAANEQKLLSGQEDAWVCRR